MSDNVIDYPKSSEPDFEYWPAWKKIALSSYLKIKLDDNLKIIGCKDEDEQ